MVVIGVYILFEDEMVTKLVLSVWTRVSAKTLKYILDTKKVNVFEDDIFSLICSMDFAHDKKVLNNISSF